MAKTKGKKNIAASIVPAMVEAVSGNDMIAESAPSESVENNEAAITTVLDKPEELHKKEEETKDGPDETEKVDENDETNDGSDEFREVDKKEETKTGTNEAEKVDENEEAKDGSNESREVDKKEETEIGADESEEEETEDRPVEPEEDKTDDRSDESEEEETEDHPVESEDYKAEESEDIDEMEESEDGLHNSEDEDGKEETENAVVESEEGEKDAKQVENAVPMGTDVPEGKKLSKRVVMGTDVPGGEKVEEGAAIKDVKDLGKEENAPKKKVKRIRKGKKKVASNDADKLSGADKQAAAATVKKDMKKTDGMGLIFMCNAKTKMDCFRYKVFGLPASKKEMVAKIYKGMRLFLFDIDLKLLYGIYKAAAPGGYNIEPKAFKSGFPSQVRYHVLSDCLPLPEEKFKSAIKRNYYGRNKFNCELSQEQVKELCKLFQSAGKTINKKRPREVVRTEPAQISSSQGQKRARRERVRRDDIIPRGRDSYSRREAYPSPPPRSRDFAPRSRDVRAELGRTSSYQRQKRSIRERVRRDDRIPRGPDPYARLEVYSSPPRALALPPPPLPQAPYAYGRSVDDYYYRREAPLLDPRDRRVVDLEIRPVEPLGYRDPYSLYREPMLREAGYREPMLREAGYRVPLSREAGYMEPLSREAGYMEPLSREAGYMEPLSREAGYKEPWSREAVPPLYYRY